MRKGLLLLIICCLGINAYSQDFSNKGKDFWLAYSYHVGMQGGTAPVMTLYITSDVSTTYNVSIYGGAIIQAGPVSANQVVAVVIPNAYFISADGVFNNRAIRVTAAKPIIVYSYITRSQASAATLCLPKNVLGVEYRAMSFKQTSNENNSNSFITIVGVEDNTNIEIIPSASTVGGWAAGSVNNITLNKGQIYQVLGTTSGFNGVDLSGTKIKSIASGSGGCKKIAVFSGSGKIQISNGSCGSNSSDNLYQQLYPLGSWGKKYLTVPSASRPSNFYRIWRSDPASIITLNGVLVPPASFVNDYYEFFNAIPNKIESNLPVAVTQYFTTQNCNGNASPYDPDMIVLNPVEQNISNVTLISSNLTVAGTHQHKIHVILKNEGTALSSFRFDNSSVNSTLWQTHPEDASYSYLYLSVSETSHTLLCDSGFNALAYGYGNAETYGYSAGTYIKDLYQQIGVSSQYGIETSPSVCTGSPFQFKVSLPYCVDSIKWNLGNLPGPITPAVRQVNYTSCTTGTGGPDSTNIVNGKTIYWYSLPTFFSLNTVGTYPVLLTTYTSNPSTCGSEQDVDFDLEVSDPPLADFTWNAPACPAEIVQFTDNSTTTKPTYHWWWSFGDAASGANNTSLLKNPSHLFSGPGTYTVRFANITTPGCLSDTISRQVVVPDYPTATITGTTSVCLNGPLPTITFSGANAVAPYVFTYNINGGTNQTILSTGTTATINAPTSIAGNFSYNLVSVQNSTNPACIRNVPDTAVIIVFKLPTPGFTISNPSCETGIVQFTDTSRAWAGTITNWSWDFGDPASGAANQSILQNPVHLYTSAGTYTITLSLTTSNGCSLAIPYTKSIIVHDRPLAGYIIPEVCLSDTYAQFTDSSKVLNGTISAWYWNFGDANANAGNPNTSSAQNPTHSYTAVGNYSVQLIAVSSQGCRDTIAQQLVINGSFPVANFTIQNAASLCSNDSIRINNTSTVFPGSITKVEIYWDNIAAPTIYETDDFPTPGKMYAHLYPAFQSPLTKSVTIRYRAYSGGVCVNDKLSVITLHATPRLRFDPVPNVCYDAAAFQITQAVETGGVPGTFLFSGPGVSSSGIFNPVAAGIGTFTIRCIYISSAAGCLDSASQTITVIDTVATKFDFVAPACAGFSALFNNSSTVPAGVTILKTVWDFGDGSPIDTFPLASPVTHVFANWGNFNVKMHTLSTTGCISAVRSRQVYISPIPTADFSFVDPFLCLPNAELRLTESSFIADNSESSFTYTWDFGDPLSGTLNASLARTPPPHLYSGLGPYLVKLSVKSGDQCLGTASKIVNFIHPQPVAAFTTNKAAICVGDNVTFTDRSDGLDGSVTKWFWNFQDGSSSLLQNPTHSFLTPNVFDIKHWITNSIGCNSDTAHILFSVNAFPVVDAGPDLFVLQGGSIELKTLITGTELSYAWTPGTYLNATDLANPVAINVQEDITYRIEVTAKGGCSASDVVFLKVLRMPVIPNTFSPNGDGINDKWIIQYLETYPDNRVQVFTRTGQMVFESRGYRTPWDGNMKGKSLPIDTYYYIIEPGNGRKPITGYITILK